MRRRETREVRRGRWVKIRRTSWRRGCKGRTVRLSVWHGGGDEKGMQRERVKDERVESKEVVSTLRAQAEEDLNPPRTPSFYNDCTI